MPKKRKTAKKKRSKSNTRIKKSQPKAKQKSKRRRLSASPVVEPTSGSASSSLDPRRAGRLQLRNTRKQNREEQIGDLQGISLEDRADSESVGELLEEGQTLEAEAVKGIEDALDADQGEVRTTRCLRTTFPASTWTATRFWAGKATYKKIEVGPVLPLLRPVQLIRQVF